MRIRELHLMNFGKFTDTHLYFPEQLHVIYGENEYGKSTIYAFIKAMLFGMERGKGRAAKNDLFSRYEPWENPNYYAGMMRFTCGGRNFRLERHFDRYNKRTELICEDDGEELSVEDGDLAMLLGGITEAGFENTAAIGRLSAKPGQDLSGELKNFAANYYETGSGEINLEGALERLKIRKREVEKEQKNLRELREKEREKVEDRIRYVEKEREDIARKIQEKQGSWEEEKQRQKQLTGQYKEVKKRMQTRKESEMANEDLAAGKKQKGVGIGLLAIAILLLAGGNLLKLPMAVTISAILIFIGGVGCLIWKSSRGSRKTDEARAAEEKTDRDEKELFRLRELIEIQNENVKRAAWQMEEKRGDYQEKQVEVRNLEEQLSEMEMRSPAEKKLDHTLDALELAEERLKENARGMSDRFGMRLNEHASEILAQITEGKYGRLFIENNLELSVYHDGKKIPAERLSRGTVEQIYFSLRMAVLDLMYEEDIPVLLDDAFSSYDEKRLKSVLKWLSRQQRQVIIFSCQKREEEIIKMF